MPPKKKTEKVEWTFNGEVINKTEQTPKGSFAFIYMISLLDGSGRYYIGKKYIWKPKYTSGAKKGESKGSYPWQSYCSSSVELKALIKIGTPYKKEILFFTFSKIRLISLSDKAVGFFDSPMNLPTFGID